MKIHRKMKKDERALKKGNCRLFGMKSFWRSALLVATIAMCGSCADGYESPDGFDTGVKNQTLITPDSLTFKVSTDGTQATISWPLIMGSKGFLVTMMNIDDAENPVVVDDYDGKLVDGCSMTATIAEDSKYSFSFQAIGDTKRGNRDGEQFDTIFSTLVPSICTIPNGSDIYTYLQENPLDSVGGEVAIDLEPGGEYTMSGPVDFQYFNMTFRGNKVKPAIVKMTGNAAFYTYSGLKFKFLRFDMTECTATGFLCMSNTNLPDSILSQNLGYMRNGSPIKGIYNILDPIYFSDVWFKNLSGSFIYDNEVSCAWWNLTVTDCIIQMNNTKRTFISFEKKGVGIKYLTIKNSTIYNICDNSTSYFLRFSNQSSANPQKIWGTTNSELASWNFVLSRVTLSRCFTGQKWANNINGTGFGCRFDHTIFYHLYQPFRRILEKGFAAGTSSMKFNFFYNPDSPTDSDYKRDVNGAPCASLYDPMFEGDVNQELDFSKPNGGVNFTPLETVIVENNGGDPRWLPKRGSSDSEEENPDSVQQ